MSTAIKTDIRDEVLRALKVAMAFAVQPDDTGETISEYAIVIQKVNAKVGTNQLADFPGLIVSMPRQTVIPPGDGENNSDMWHYQVLIQLLDRDLWDIENRVASWDKWIEQIASYFNFNDLTAGSSDLASKVTWALCTARQVSDIDEKMWIKSSEFIAGVMLEVQVLQHRGVIA
jgi:hypothetical protein